jgi:hypothetical protein
LLSIYKLSFLHFFVMSSQIFSSHSLAHSRSKLFPDRSKQIFLPKIFPWRQSRLATRKLRILSRNPLSFSTDYKNTSGNEQLPQLRKCKSKRYCRP